MKVYIKGSNSCMNRKSDLYRYREYIIACGHEVVSKEEEADTFLVWGCSFREDYHDNSFRTVAECQRRYSAEVILCGCLPSIDPSGVRERHKGRYFPWKDQDTMMTTIFGNSEVTFDNFKRTYVESAIHNLEQFKAEHPNSKVVFHDQFSKLFISEGCSLNCTYCSDIMAFPKYKSNPLDQLTKDADTLFKNTGQTRFLFCGDSIGDYGKDIGATLIDLVDSILSIDNSIQVGFNNFNPLHFLDYFDDLVCRFYTNKVCFLDLPIQSADDRILRLMRRGYRVADISRIFQAINSSGFKELETDVIVGFPSESDGDFMRTTEFLLRHKPKYVQVSSYMDVIGSKASEMADKVPDAVISARLAFVREQLGANGILFDRCGENTLKDWPILPCSQ